MTEEQALKTLLESSPEFKGFYENERSKIKPPIDWIKDETLPGVIRSLYLPELKRSRIFIKRAPLEVEDAFEAARELRHLICTLNGFPGIEPVKLNFYTTRTNTIGLLANMLKDPLANEGLIEYGFDLWPYFDRTCEIQCNNPPFSFQDQPESKKERLQLVALYVQKSLVWELANSIKPRPNNQFNDWFQTNYPDVVSEAEEVLGWVKEAGFATPKQAEAILKEMIKRYEFEGTLKIGIIKK